MGKNGIPSKAVGDSLGTSMLFIGPILAEFQHTRNIAASSATSEFIKTWVNEVRKRCRVQHINFVPDRRWPFGSMIPRSGLGNDDDRIDAKYLNIPLLSYFTKSISLLLALIFSIKKQKHVNTAIFFNWHYYYLPAFLVGHLFEIRCVILQADFRVPFFIKHVIYQNYNSFITDSKKKVSAIYFPGFQDVKYNQPKKISRILAYAGGYGVSSNIGNFIRWFLETDICCELRLFGKISDELKQIVKSDKRVKTYGFVSTSELDRLLGECTFFVESRNEEYKDFAYSFPSKILYYRKFGGIVFTNALSPMSPNMRESFIDITHDYAAVADIISLEDAQLETLQRVKYESFIVEMQRLENHFYAYISG